MAGSCDGGSAEGAFQFAQSGIPLDTCLSYEADDLACTPINTCRTCVGPPVRNTKNTQNNTAERHAVTECNGQPPPWHLFSSRKLTLRTFLPHLPSFCRLFPLSVPLPLFPSGFRHVLRSDQLHQDLRRPVQVRQQAGRADARLRRRHSAGVKTTRRAGWGWRLGCGADSLLTVALLFPFFSLHLLFFVFFFFQRHLGCPEHHGRDL